MKTLFFWEDCDEFDLKMTAYWIEVPLEFFRDEIEGIVPGTGPYVNCMDDYLEMVDRLSKQFPELIKKDHIYLLASQDGMAYKHYGPMMPYSGQWNGYCPLVPFQKDFSSLSCLSTLDAKEDNRREPTTEMVKIVN